jgi:hypothetical protein
MESIPATAENNTLFEIDQELEAAFETASQEQEETGAISEEAKQQCLNLFAELGKKVDRIARYVRAMELRARAAKEESARLAARQKSAENRVEQVKSMLSFFMQSRGLKRLEGDLNTIRLQKNGQASLQLNPAELPNDYSQTELALSYQDWLRLLDAVACTDLKAALEAAVTKVEANKELIRQLLQSGREIPGAQLVKGSHIRFE